MILGVVTTQYIYLTLHYNNMYYKIKYSIFMFKDCEACKCLYEDDCPTHQEYGQFRDEKVFRNGNRYCLYHFLIKTMNYYGYIFILHIFHYISKIFCFRLPKA